MKNFLLSKTLIFIITVSSLTIFSGCATLFGDKNRIVHVTSNVKNADVYLNNNKIGKTPMDVEIPSMYGSNFITVKKFGFLANTQNIIISFQPITLLDIIFWPTLIVDAGTGNMMKIQSTQMNIDLDKK